MVPIENYGVKCMSMGFLVPENSPIVWRAPMVCLLVVQGSSQLHANCSECAVLQSMVSDIDDEKL